MILALLVVLPGGGRMAAIPHLPIPKDGAVILNTGSTNVPGYRIVIQRSGKAQYVHNGNRSEGSIPSDLAAKFFTNLQAAMPLSKLPTEQCMKSVSFGSSTFLWWRGQRSQDVSCPGDDRARALYEDAQRIADALKIPVGPVMRPMLPNEPRKPLPPEPTPSPS